MQCWRRRSRAYSRAHCAVLLTSIHTLCTTQGFSRLQVTGASSQLHLSIRRVQIFRPLCTYLPASAQPRAHKIAHACRHQPLRGLGGLTLLTRNLRCARQRCGGNIAPSGGAGQPRRSWAISRHQIHSRWIGDRCAAHRRRSWTADEGGRVPVTSRRAHLIAPSRRRPPSSRTRCWWTSRRRRRAVCAATTRPCATRPR